MYPLASVDTAVLHVIEAVTRSGVNSHLGHALADRLTVAEVAGFRGTEAGEDAGPTEEPSGRR